MKLEWKPGSVGLKLNAAMQYLRLQVGEDWQLSQFWYSEATAGALAGAVLSAAGPAGRVACVSAPTLYTACR